jgi:formylglycine-generating enzyme required for sulfatase activity
MAASTTGNIYGIYDMNGCSWEYTAAYINNGNANITTYASSLKNAAAQYKDIYPKAATDSSANNYSSSVSLKGDAIYETSSAGIGSTSWYTDFSNMSAVNSPLFSRGGYYLSSTSGGIYAFYYVDGAATTQEFSFRPVLLVGSGL